MATLKTDENGVIRLTYQDENGEKFIFGISSDDGMSFAPNSIVEIEDSRLDAVADIWSKPFGFVNLKRLEDE